MVSLLSNIELSLNTVLVGQHKRKLLSMGFNSGSNSRPFAHFSIKICLALGNLVAMSFGSFALFEREQLVATSSFVIPYCPVAQLDTSIVKFEGYCHVQVYNAMPIIPSGMENSLGFQYFL